MGWLFSTDSRHDKAAQVAEFRRPEFWTGGTVLLADRIVGNHYWAAVRLSTGYVTIVLALMKKGGRNEGYGYKLMDETVHPYCYDCPLPLLRMVTDRPYNDNAAQWRERVLKHHAQKANRTLPQPGSEVSIAGMVFRLIAPAGPRKGWLALRLPDRATYRLTSRQLANASNANG